jgi:hypothetical protein
VDSDSVNLGSNPSSPASNKHRRFLQNIALSDPRKKRKRRNGTRTDAGTKVGTAAHLMIHPQFRTKLAQRRGAMTTRRLVPILNEFAERTRSRPKGAGTKVGTARRAQFAAIRLERTAADEERNRALVISLEGLGAFRCNNAYSDKRALFDAFEPKRVIGAVRMYSARPHTPGSSSVQHDRQRAPIIFPLVGGQQ